MFLFIILAVFIIGMSYMDHGTIKARPRSAVGASNDAQYAVNRKYGVAWIPSRGKTSQLCLQYEIQFPFLRFENVSAS